MANIRHQLQVQAPAEAVFVNLTTQNGLAGWWTPDVNAKAEVGSILRFGFGPSYFKEMKVMKLGPEKKVEWKCIVGAEEWIGTTIQFTLEKADAKTIVHFSHDNWESLTPMFSQCSYDWAMFLRSLKHLCEKGKGFPFPDQHQ
ncbi:MAG: SRPBCC domain-containing protein [Cyclobacteriaceae bacterium]